MGWFARKTDTPHDDAELLDWDETTPDEPTIHDADHSLRRLINGATILLIVTLLAASAHGWLGPLGGVWTTIFPPPPYAGPLVYASNDDGLVAMRFTDGQVQWRASNLIDEYSTMLHDTRNVYIIRTINQQVVALQAQTGKEIWHVPSDPGFSLYSGWLSDSHLYIVANEMSTAATHSLLEMVDTQTGHLMWKTEIRGTAAFPASLHADRVFFCATVHDANTDASTVIMSGLDSQTGKTQWQQSAMIAADGGFGCGEAGNLVFIQNYGNTMENTLVLLDEKTGIPQRQIQLLGQIIGADQQFVYTTTYGPPSVAQELQAVSLSDGVAAWHLTGDYAPFYSPNTQGNTNLSPAALIATDDDGLVGINLHTGAIIWHWASSEVNNTTNGDTSIAVSGVGNTIYFSGRTGIAALDSATGQLLWHTALTTITDANLQLVYEQQTLFVATKGHFQALRAQNGKILWTQGISVQNVFCLECGNY